MKKLADSFVNITDREFHKLSELIYDLFGIYLSNQKKHLVENRLNKILRDLKFDTFTEYYNYLLKDESRSSLIDLIDRISTNHTYFYREKQHFEYLINHALPDIVKNKNQYEDIRIWSAGCSSGEEAYTLAIIANEFKEMNFLKNNIKVLGTDISGTALQKAKAGIYDINALQLLPDKYTKRYFKELDLMTYEVKDNVKDKVTFGKLNFNRQEFPFKNKFDIIFLRNVLIYFDDETRVRVIRNIEKHLAIPGFLFLGHSETKPVNCCLHLTRVFNSAYYKAQ